jgi:polyhydroxyalkanoate synthesis regulator phasin
MTHCAMFILDWYDAVRNLGFTQPQEDIIMVAQAQPNETTDANVVKKFVTETKDQLEKVWTDTFSQLNTRFQEREKDVRDFLNKLENDGRKRFETLSQSMREQLNVDDILAKLKTNELVDQGAKIGEDIVEQGLKISEEAIDKLGFARSSEIVALAAELEKLAQKVETVRKKASTASTKKVVDELKKRVMKLEKAVASK